MAVRIPATVQAIGLSRMLTKRLRTGTASRPCPNVEVGEVFLAPIGFESFDTQLATRCGPAEVGARQSAREKEGEGTMATIKQDGHRVATTGSAIDDVKGRSASAKMVIATTCSIITGKLAVGRTVETALGRCAVASNRARSQPPPGNSGSAGPHRIAPVRPAEKLTEPRLVNYSQSTSCWRCNDKCASLESWRHPYGCPYQLPHMQLSGPARSSTGTAGAAAELHFAQHQCWNTILYASRPTLVVLA